MRIGYVKVGPKAEECFVNLVENGSDYLRFSYSIACAMSDKPLDEGWRTVKARRIWGPLATVSARYATLYRRAFDGLGLVEDIPGQWNSEVFDKPKFDHHSIEEDCAGYEDYTDWSDLNFPAELYLRTADPDAYRAMTEGHDVYVLSRNLDAVRGYDNKGVAYGDIEATKSVWIVRESTPLLSAPIPEHSLIEEIGGGEGVQPHRDNNQSIYPCDGTELAHPPATVLLVKQQEFTWSSRRSRPGSCLMAELQRPLSVPELVDMTGTRRRTVYDRISRGKALKIADGQYWCLCHPKPPQTREI